MSTPDELRAAAAARLTPPDRPARPSRRRAVSSTLGEITVTATAAPADPVAYSTSNITRGVALGPTYTQVSVKLPDDPLGDALRSALADGIGDSISDVARQWLAVGADQYLQTKATPAADPNEGNPTT